MKIALLQDEIYLPSLAGGIKANRLLLEGFADRGHECLAQTRALTRSSDGPRDRSQFFEELNTRKLDVRKAAADVFSYTHQDVHVEALDHSTSDERRDYLTRRLQEFRPDCVLVADDKRRFILESAIRAVPNGVVPLVQTIMQLPFGPLAVHESQRQTDLMAKARKIIVISNYVKQYIETHSSLRAELLHMPVYGPGPFPNLARFDAGFVTMINPCELKGVSIFLTLARQFPNVEFAALPTWGADDKILSDLRSLHNVRILQPADNIETILAQTRVLLVPSLWPETFGYVVPEAMLRGIPVLASNIGGLPEAKLGVDYLLPVAPAVRDSNAYVCPPQEIGPWSKALGELLSDSRRYYCCSRESREAALKFNSGVTISAFEALLTELCVTHG